MKRKLVGLLQIRRKMYKTQNNTKLNSDRLLG